MVQLLSLLKLESSRHDERRIKAASRIID